MWLRTTCAMPMIAVTKWDKLWFCAVSCSLLVKP
ncbi:Uncharacterised protein [Vibrio cholerae]|nr:Uncharacterised protein [Vibrio cholerae]CSI53089.1 Uncharacterised protein [Vibrio cholerae]